MYVLPTIEELRVSPDYHGFFEDFNHAVSADLWTITSASDGSATVGDAAGGIMALVTDATDNDSELVATTHELFKIAASKPMVMEFCQKFSQAAINAANVGFGSSNAAAATSLADDGAGPAADFSGAMFYTVDGDTTWRCIYSDGTTQTIVELDADGSLDGVAKTAASTTYQVLRIEIIPVTSSLVDVMFYIDGVLVCKMKDKTLASATEMDVFILNKAGTAAAQTVNCDYAAAFQKR